MKAGDGPPIGLGGGAELFATLSDAGLIDDYRFLIMPTAIGKGKAMFGALEEPLKFKLVATRAFSSGGVLLEYVSGRKDGEQRKAKQETVSGGKWGGGGGVQAVCGLTSAASIAANDELTRGARRLFEWLFDPERQAEPELSAAGLTALRPDAAAHRRHELAAHEQADAGAGRRRGASERKYSSNSWSASSAAMPGPSSSTRTDHLFPAVSRP